MITLTNMCLIINDKNEILFQDRLKNDWPGLNLPGGHVEVNESIKDSVIREIKEETNLTLIDLEFVNYFEWINTKISNREIVFLFTSNNFKGEIINSLEGKLYWLKIEDLKDKTLSLDLDKILKLFGFDINSLQN